MATTYHTDIQKLYVAYFNRPADFAGLNYWEAIVEAAKGSTTAVSAAFAAEAEYKTEFAGMSNAQVVAKVYLNLFGRVAEAAGVTYWADLLDKKAITIDKVVTQIAAGAQGTDQEAYENKVIAASAFTAALDTATEQNGYRGAAANTAAKAFMAGITTDASLTAAIAPASLGAAVATVVAAGTPFTLPTALERLDTAVDAKAAFLVTADGDTDAKTSATDATIKAKVDAAIAAIDLLVEGNYTGASAGGKAALLTGQQAINAAKLADDQAAVVKANADIAKVAGLSAAVATLTTAEASVKAANTGVVNANADLAAKLAAYNSLNTTTLTMSGNKGEVAGLIVIDAETKKLVLATGVTEAKNPGVTALLASSIAHETADATYDAAFTARAAAKATVDALDLTAAAIIELGQVAALMTVVNLDEGVLPTSAQITTELNTLKAVSDSATAVAGQATATEAEKADAVKALAAYTAFKAEVDQFIAADTANPRLDALASAGAAVTADTKVIADLNKALTGLATANETATQLGAVNASIKAAQDAFISHDLMLPVTLAGAAVATSGADIYVAGTADSSILNFSLLGNDSLFIGSDYTLNAGKLTAGNNSVLEVFFVETAAGVEVHLETTAFSSNSAEDEVVITLTGVAIADVHLSNGIITVG